jgi:hypothetical protein
MRSIPRNVKTSEIINLDVFIIPNDLQKFGSMLPILANDLQYKMNDFGIGLDEDDLLVQVWITDTLPVDDPNHVDNWSNDCPKAGACLQNLRPSEPLRKDESDPLRIQLPFQFPISIFKWKSEMESVSITSSNGVKYILRLNQKCYRYRHLGKFDAALASLIDKCYM